MKKVIILLGPTGVGKTGVSILLAKELNTEIISADSMQIYRHMDIGTAKPSKEEMAMVKHHMIDIVDPCELYSTGAYIRAVEPVIKRIHRQGKIPVIVGGTGLYIKAMTRGMFSGPSADWSLRKELALSEKEERGLLYRYLKKLDAEAAEKIAPNDTRRVIRALEVHLKSCLRISEMQKKLTHPLPYEFNKIGLSRDRKELYRRIEQRVDSMMQAGLIKEVKKVKNFIKEKEEKIPCISMQAIGYKEIELYLRGEILLDNAVWLIKRETKRYAKRQFTWFRKEKGIHWLDITGIDNSSEVFLQVMSFLKNMRFKDERKKACNMKRKYSIVKNI